jgi:hypothetical protein
LDIEILHEERLREWCGKLNFPSEGIDELAAVAACVRTDAALKSIFTEFHEKTALRGEWHRDWSDLPMHPDAQAALGDRVTLFYLLAYLAALPYTCREYERRGISREIFWASMEDIRRYYLQAYEIEGAWRFRNFAWIWRHLSCELFRLGRLQFMLLPFEGRVTALRKRSSAEILLLADPAVRLRADGYALGAGRREVDAPAVDLEASAWQPVFEERADGWRGNPVSPYGYSLKAEVFLPAAEWELALRQGDIVLDIHIPPTDSFKVEDCRDSLRQAHDFFARYSPERPIKASFCHTWFFTPQLQQLLPPESNVVRFQREFYLFPFAGGPGFLWNFVFGEKITDPASAPRDTSLRRAVLDWLAAGKELFDLPGVAFHAPEAWGSQPYMSRFTG